MVINASFEGEKDDKKQRKTFPQQRLKLEKIPKL